MAVTNRKSRWSKIPERFIFITTPILTLWLIGESLYFNSFPDVCTSDICNSYEFREGEIIGMFLFPILLGISYLALGLLWRRNRIKKEKQAMK